MHTTSIRLPSNTSNSKPYYDRITVVLQRPYQDNPTLDLETSIPLGLPGLVWLQREFEYSTDSSIVEVYKSSNTTDIYEQSVLSVDVLNQEQGSTHEAVFSRRVQRAPATVHGHARSGIAHC